MKVIYLILLSLCICNIATAQTPKAAPPKAAATKGGIAKQPSPVKPTEEVSQEEMLNGLAEAHQLWGPQMNTALATISLQQVSKNGDQYTYHLFASGMAPGSKLYKVVAWPVNQPKPVEIVKGVALDPTGMAYCPGQLGTCGTVNLPNDPLNLTITLAPGRPVRVGLVAQDESERAFVNMIPLPIRAQDKGCTLEVTTLTPSAAIALVEGSGFGANAEIDMQVENGGERNGGKTRVDEQGKYSATLVPAKEGVRGGVMRVSVTSARCSPSIAFDWGAKDPPPTAAPAKNSKQ